MPESKKKTCSYKWEFVNYKCNRPLFDENDEYCIFHSWNHEGKKERFIKAFKKEYELQKKNNSLNFTGFVFPHWIDLGSYDLRGAKLMGSTLTKADLRRAKLQGADLRGATMEKAIVYKVEVDRQTKFLGIDVTQAKGSPHFVRFAKDQDFLEELRSTKRGEWIYKIWNFFADCGRSFLRWALWSLIFGVMFAIVYELIYYCSPSTFKADFISPAWSGISFLYYSIVTFTTLGFGDIVPKSPWVQLLVTLEVILGYIMLGGLISIFANKLARRS